MKKGDHTGQIGILELCRSFFKPCCHPEEGEKKPRKGNFQSCEQFMKSFYDTQDKKINFETCRSKMAGYFGGNHQEPGDKTNISSTATNHGTAEGGQQNEGK